MTAGGKGHVECLKELIAGGADINKQDNDGRTALWIAVDQDHVECLKEIISAEADINKEDIHGQTALRIAAGQGHIECLKELITAGSDINKEDKKGQTALWIAAKKGHVECLNKLIVAGADINKEDKDGDTALMAAVDFPNANIVSLLLSKGAEVNTKNNEGKTALYLGVNRCHSESQAEQSSSKPSIYMKILYALFQAGAKIDESDTKVSPTSAHLIPIELKKPNTGILKMLVAAGAVLKERRLFQWDDSLQGSAKNSIRKYLKQIYPERNLYTIIPHLGLPHAIRA